MKEIKKFFNNGSVAVVKKFRCGSRVMFEGPEVAWINDFGRTAGLWGISYYRRGGPVKEKYYYRYYSGKIRDNYFEVIKEQEYWKRYRNDNS